MNSVRKTIPTCIFARDASAAKRLPFGSSVIFPSNDDWNDYGYQLRAKIALKIDDATTVVADILIGFYEEDAKEDNGRIRLIQLIGSSKKTIEANLHKFFIMLPSIQSYRDLASSIKPPALKKILINANELATLKHFKPTSKIIPKATKERVFNLGFLRDSEVHFALHNAGSIIQGLSNEKTVRPATQWRLNFNLDKKHLQYEFDINFNHESELPRRIAVIIGKNGVGKSQSLNAICRSLLSRENHLRESESGDRPQISRLIAFASTIESISTFPAERRTQRTWYKRHHIGSASKQKVGSRLPETILRISQSEQSIASRSRLSIFNDSLSAIRDHEQLALVRTDGGIPVRISEIKSGTSIRNLEQQASIDPQKDPVRVVNGKATKLSSGELSFINFSALACESIENGSLILLDEPETHLHPNFISEFAALLDRILELTGSSAIIATHSSYFVREVFKEQVSVIEKDEDGKIQVLKPRLRTFGADVGAISRFVFGENSNSSISKRVKRRILNSNNSWESIYETYKDELSLETLGEIHELILNKEST
ncbi:AAA family ATPase [Stenotrophomonas sp.]|uniref:AAA family ATPase n=1 Tax=Stenotrophomonas sp. TaxID=69392 RepID=UPI00289A545E|nr:AAA family ATPase [Stenotrophomonas sp.]